MTGGVSEPGTNPAAGLHEAGLSAAVRCEHPELTADIRVAPGVTLGVIGPNGAGKSTLLSILAGVRRTTDSTVTLGDRTLQSRGTFIEPHRRSVVLLEQKARLFSHLSVRRNVAFGPSAAGLSRRDARDRAQKWMEAVGVAALADRMPAGLSGGQAQRVAIARALATEPAVLLLDEPFAALDVDVAQQMRSLMRALLADRAGITILVTHDLIDVVSLAGEIAVIDSGRIVQTGPTTTVLTHPETAFGATLSGVNLIVGAYQGNETIRAECELQVVGTCVETLSAGVRAAAAFSPRAVAVYLHQPHGSPRNTWAGVVEEILPHGDRALVRARCGERMLSAEVTWTSVADLGLGSGTRVHLSVKATEVRVYGAAGEALADSLRNQLPS